VQSTHLPLPPYCANPNPHQTPSSLTLHPLTPPVVYPHKANREVGDHLRASLEQLLRRHLVDATLAGHVHSYYRSCAAYDGRCVGAGAASAAGGGAPAGGAEVAGGGGGGGGHGTVHVVVGSGGHVLSDLEEGQEEWVAAAAQQWGYVRVSVASPERAAVEFVSSASGEVLDAFEVAATPERLAGACPAARRGRGAGAAAGVEH
jgi:hypothetical protein